MATLLIATPFVHSNALRNRASIAEVRGFQGQKKLLVSCRQASVSAKGEGYGANASDNVGSQDEIGVLQSSSSPLLNISPADWIATFFEKEVHVKAPQAVAAPTFQLLEPASEFEATNLHQGKRRRSERPVIFTEEKARRLRKENRATQTFHDKWYHSAIASRLAIPE